MNRAFYPAMALVVLLLGGCANQPSEPEPPPPPAETPPPVPPPPTLIDVLPEFKKASREFLDFAKQLDELAAKVPPPVYQIYWKDSLRLEELYGKVIANEPKHGSGAHAFERINKIRDSLFKTQLILKNTEELRATRVVQNLETEAAKRKPFFDEAEFFWKETPDKTDEKELLRLQMQG